MEEVWKDVVGYEDYFKVSNLGRVWSKRTSKVLKQTKLKCGYLVLNTRLNGRDGGALSLRVHRLVAKAFLPNPSDDLVRNTELTVYGKVLVNHKDCDKTNNKVTNLEWTDYAGNSKHAVDSGRMTYDRPNSATEDQIQYIISNHGKISNREIARRLNICRSTVGLVIKKNSPVV